ncbi:trehalose-phosphatase [Limoniibacter endophyticus]|uniref:Trehalose 6-phosphate phosphatase n=1 Tax=Limoniibacter endophyticus TaxID=1565040 RepID=A0A8J3GHM8_9HYPH|nr:trehalose-phosphatase [Limoniibacter endophyticus]GHC73131.1 trehalose 6-phosphate phosphatase [Limoniibacter endophyticus]
MTIERLPSFLPPEKTAFFFDLDGTLAPIVEDPAKAAVPGKILRALAIISETSGGAVAVVSGRSIEMLDNFLSPVVLPLAGVHGMERRLSDGSSDNALVDEVALQALSANVERFCAHHPGLLFEEKPGSVALHYRTRSDLAETCARFAADLGANPAIRVLPGKMVFEFKLGVRTKADAIERFMSEAPFKGRTPFFAGDDVTDEFGFDAVNRLGGIGLKIGKEETKAQFHCEDITEFHAWMTRLAETFAAKNALA